MPSCFFSLDFCIFQLQFDVLSGLLRQELWTALQLPFSGNLWQCCRHMPVLSRIHWTTVRFCASVNLFLSCPFFCKYLYNQGAQDSPAKSIEIRLIWTIRQIKPLPALHHKLMTLVARLFVTIQTPRAKSAAAQVTCIWPCEGMGMYGC